MKASPFPGMDPWRELHWGDVHHPILPIPLRKGESPISLDLQAIVDDTYVRGRYESLDHALELDPPLSSEDAAWAQALRNSAKT